MSRKFTIWENDMTEDIDYITSEFMALKFPGYEVEQLSALSHRHPDDIFETIKESYGIVIRPNLLEAEQIKEIAKFISHPIHGDFCRNDRQYSIQRFVFISPNPWETLLEIKRVLTGVKDSHGELCLMKIIKHCTTEFYNFNATVCYELVTDGYFDTKAIRYA